MQGVRTMFHQKSNIKRKYRVHTHGWCDFNVMGELEMTCEVVPAVTVVFAPSAIWRHPTACLFGESVFNELFRDKFGHRMGCERYEHVLRLDEEWVGLGPPFAVEYSSNMNVATWGLTDNLFGSSNVGQMTLGTYGEPAHMYYCMYARRPNVSIDRNVTELEHASIHHSELQ